jgi:hypothetical protein
MRMRRTDHHGINLAGQVLVGGVTAAAANQSQILAAAHRLADTEAVNGLRACCLVHCLPCMSFRAGVKRNDPE